MSMFHLYKRDKLISLCLVDKFLVGMLKEELWDHCISGQLDRFCMLQRRELSPLIQTMNKYQKDMG